MSDLYYIVHAGRDCYSNVPTDNPPKVYFCDRERKSFDKDDSNYREEWDNAQGFLFFATTAPEECSENEWILWENRAICHKCYHAVHTPEGQMELLRVTEIA